MRQLLPVESVHSVGSHAVTVDSAQAITEPDESPTELTQLDRRADVTANSVLTESGRELGTVRDVVIVGGRRPRVVGFQISGGAAGDGFVPIDASGAVSASTLVVPDSFENRIRTDLLGLAGEIADLDRGSP